LISRSKLGAKRRALTLLSRNLTTVRLTAVKALFGSAKPATPPIIFDGDFDPDRILFDACVEPACNAPAIRLLAR
jgi:hypothetical protein